MYLIVLVNMYATLVDVWDMIKSHEMYGEGMCLKSDTKQLSGNQANMI